jgi:hypothetical protein
MPQPGLHIANIFKLASQAGLWEKPVVHRGDYEPEGEEVLEEGATVVRTTPT